MYMYVYTCIYICTCIYAHALFSYLTHQKRIGKLLMYEHGYHCIFAKGKLFMIMFL